MNIELIQSNDDLACWYIRREDHAHQLYIYECSDCGFLVQFPCKPRYSLQSEGYRYCPYCGRKMCAIMLHNPPMKDDEE